MKKIIILSITLVATNIMTAQDPIVNIPDPNFKNYLLNHTGINTNGDNEIQDSEAVAFSGTIQINNKNISDLTGIEAFVNLKILMCQSNNITSLDLSNNINLTKLYCSYNPLTSLDLSNNTNLIELDCYKMDNLTSLDLSNNTNLQKLNCSDNQLMTSLDVNNNTNLLELNCSYNQSMASLDVSNNTNLKVLWCNNSNLTSLILGNNPNLEFIYCFNNSLIDLDVSNCTNLEGLNCDNNQLTSLTLGNTTKLSYLLCFNNNLTSLDLSNNTALTTLHCYDNQITSLDVSNNTALTILYCGNNPLTSIDVSNNVNLSVLECHQNQLTSLDLSNNVNLSVLECHQNQLTSLDIGNNTNLKFMHCYDNQITSLDVSNNAYLQRLKCSKNPLTSLDLSNNTVLWYLDCGNNQLTSLNLKNVENTSLELNAKENPNLFCIEVDDPDWSNANWTSFVDSQANFSDDCSCVVNIPDENFKNALLNYDPIIDINGDGEIQCYEAIAFTGTINVNNKNISDLTGIEAFVNITALYCNNNQLTSLDVSNNTNLITLDCSYNQLTILDLSNNTNLEYLDCSNNQLIILILNNNNQLKGLDINSNNTNTSLKELNCSYNQLTSLDLSNIVNLEKLDCIGNQLTYLNLKNGNNSAMSQFVVDFQNNNLSCILVDDVDYANANWSSLKDATACFSESCSVPEFPQVPIICQGESLVPTLSAISDDNITGTWSPVTIDSSIVGTQNFVFTPNNACLNFAYTMVVTVQHSLEAPTGETNQTFTTGQTIGDLVVSGVNLVWYNSTYTETFSLADELVNNQTYYVVSEMNGCQSDPLIIIVVEQVVSSTDFDLFGFYYYPNPVNDILHFSSNKPIEKVIVSNMLGQEVKVNLSSDNTNIDLSNLSKGNYFVRVTIEGVSKTIKVIKN